jgi:hypothetical protein
VLAYPPTHPSPYIINFIDITVINESARNAPNAGEGHRQANRNKLLIETIAHVGQELHDPQYTQYKQYKKYKK